MGSVMILLSSCFWYCGMTSVTVHSVTVVEMWLRCTKTCQISRSPSDARIASFASEISESARWLGTA